VGEWAAARGADLDVLHGPVVSAWPDPGDASAVVSLGSDRSVHASTDPWIAAQVGFLRATHAAGVPVLGICFGGQALAAALGATVTRADETEIGWIDVDGDDGFGGRWFTWHEDVFGLPAGATELARAPSGPQAFAVGASVGLQFHPEERRRRGAAARLDVTARFAWPALADRLCRLFTEVAATAEGDADAAVAASG
jgi:GMP synthase-like glutamine amidotransferase